MYASFESSTRPELRVTADELLQLLPSAADKQHRPVLVDTRNAQQYENKVSQDECNMRQDVGMMHVL